MDNEDLKRQDDQNDGSVDGNSMITQTPYNTLTASSKGLFGHLSADGTDGKLGAALQSLFEVPADDSGKNGDASAGATNSTDSNNKETVVMEVDAQEDSMKDDPNAALLKLSAELGSLIPPQTPYNTLNAPNLANMMSSSKGNGTSLQSLFENPTTNDTNMSPASWPSWPI